jgi:hypothetical protein
MEKNDFTDVEVYYDYAGLERMVIGRLVWMIWSLMI